MKTKTNVKGYKASENYKCLKLTYKIGKTYTQKRSPMICSHGYHFCVEIDDVLDYYTHQKGVTKIFEIEASGEICTEGDKSVTNKIRIVREIPFEEWNGLMKRNTFDDRGNIIKHISKNGKSWVCYEYDDRDNLTKKSDSGRRTETWTYNDKNKIVRWCNADGLWYTYQYDTYGNKERVEYSDGTWQLYTFTKNHKVLKYEDSTTFWYQYDLDSNGDLSIYTSGYKDETKKGLSL